MKFNLLFVDDKEKDIEDFANIFEQFSDRFNFTTLHWEETYTPTQTIYRKLEQLKQREETYIDLLVLDYYFERGDADVITAKDVLVDFRGRRDLYYRKLPIIILTDEKNWNVSEELRRKQGPIDFITKEWFKKYPEDLKSKALNMLLTCARYLIECLQDQRVRQIYGISGSEVLEILHAVRETQRSEDRRVKFIVTGHEQGAAFMANGAGRINENRVPGVCLATLGPGATNLMTGIADAYEDKSPVVIITGQAPSRRYGKESHQAENTLDMFTSFTKYYKKIESTSAIEISSAVAKAFDIARGENPGTVLLEIPNDISEGIVTNYVEPVKPFKDINSGRHYDIVSLPIAPVTMVDKAVEKITEAKRPIIIAGSGANRAAQNAKGSDLTIHGMLTELAERFRIPTTTTFMGKGSVSSKSPMCLPVVGCRQDKRDYDLANVALDAADLVITIGYDFFEFESDIWNSHREKSTNIINISFVPPQVDHCYNPDLILLGDIKENLRRIQKKLAKCDYQCSNSFWSESVVQRLKEIHYKEFRKYLDDHKFTPHKVVDTVRRILDREDDILVSDGGFSKMVTARFYDTYSPNTCLIPNGFSTVGYGVPVAVGVKMEHPDRRIVASVGDGGFMINGQELATAVHHHKNIVVIIFKDGYHGLIKIKNTGKYPVELEDEVKLPNVDFVKMAESMAAVGRKVNSKEELSDALIQALKEAEDVKSGKSTLIEAHINYYEDIKFDSIRSDFSIEKRLSIKDKITRGEDDWEQLLGI